MARSLRPARPLLALVDAEVGDKSAHAAFEASGCSMWAFDLLVDRLGARERIHVAHAKSVRAIANSRHKTDHNDAWWLGYLTYEGRLPEVFVPTGLVRDLRLATRHRAAIVRERTRAIKRVRAQLRQAGLARDLWPGALGNERGRREVEGLISELGDIAAMAISEDLRLLDEHDARIARWEARIEKLSAQMPEVITLQQVIPGMGKVLSATVIAETGPIGRFHSPKALARYAGLTPSERDQRRSAAPGGHHEGRQFGPSVGAGPCGDVRPAMQERSGPAPGALGAKRPAAARQQEEGPGGRCAQARRGDLAPASPR